MGATLTAAVAAGGWSMSLIIFTLAAGILKKTFFAFFVSCYISPQYPWVTWTHKERYTVTQNVILSYTHAQIDR